MRLRGDAARAPVLSAGSASDAAFCTAADGRVGMGEHETRHPIGERRLADAGRSAEEPRVGDATAAVLVKQRLLDLGMTVKRERLARMRDLGILASPWPGSRGVLERDRRVRGVEPLVDDRPDIVGDLVDRPVCVDQHAALRLALGQLQIGLAQLLVEVEGFGLEAVCCGAAAPLASRAPVRSRPAGRGRASGRAWCRTRSAARARGSARVDVAEHALIDAGRVDEAVADHPCAALQRRRGWSSRR